ncbi:MAG: tetratricopeptide repeat protein [bacterium]|nr:tetratricopeptide repeat protein [bacterium]
MSFRSISRPLVELVEKEKLPVDVHVLRPPTFERLREHLRERPRHYHIFHFDGHGSYRPKLLPSDGASSGLTGYQLRTLDASQVKAHEGCLAFEDEIGADELIAAGEIGALLREHGVPIVILNACQSGMLDAAAETAFASVAASLVQAGTCSVVAMAYSLMVSGAQEFLPDFYRGLFASGYVTECMRAGRRRMLNDKGRVCVRGRFDLEDWLVPVLYQREDVDLSFAADVREETKTRPQVVGLDDDLPHAFVGRDGAILQLERAMRGRPAGILVHGLGGVGKTTLARGFVEWLGQTEGLDGCFWFTFQEIRSAEFVFNRLGEGFVGPEIALMDAEQKIVRLTQIFRAGRFVIVWDNFEVVAGTLGTQAHLSDEDRGQLKAFLTALRGGRTKVVITSRSAEHWLSPERHVVPLGGLQGEERWIYCEEIHGELGLDVDRDDPEVKELMDLLEGHPLCMRVVLPELKERRAGELLTVLRSVDGGDASARLYATLGFAEEALDEGLRPLLVPLTFHERFVESVYLEAMAGQVEPSPSREEIDVFLRTLATAGLLRELGQAIFEIHPALTGYLRSSVFLQWTAVDVRDQWARTFVDVFSTLADTLGPRELDEQRFAVHLHGANFLGALVEAERLDMHLDRSALLRALGAFAENQHLFAEAEKQYKKLISLERKQGDSRHEAEACHQLGRVVEERRDFDAAERWYQKSLKINEKLGNTQGAAKTYHQLGNIAQEQRDLDAAERWYQKSLKIKETLGDEHTASTYHQIGRIAQERRDLDTAERWYKRSLKINGKLGRKRDVARTYHQLGVVAQERRDFGAAEGWYQSSLKIKEELGDKHGTADTYHQLGIIAQERRDFDAAQRWYIRSLRINEKLSNEHGAAGTYHNLGIIAALQERYEASGHWFLKSIRTFLRVNDRAYAQQGTDDFMVVFGQAPSTEQAKLRALWEDAGLPWPEDAQGD